jgi:hypothetical protein
MVTQKEKYAKRIKELRDTGLSVLKISVKLGIGRGVVNSILYYGKEKAVKKTVANKTPVKKIAKKAKQPKKAA